MVTPQGEGPKPFTRASRRLPSFAFLLLVQHLEVLSDCGGPLAPPVNDPPVRQLAMGEGFGCTSDDGAVRCWGANAQGQLGRGTKSPFELRAAPVVGLPEKVAQLAVAESSACARTLTGHVSCWGDTGPSPHEVSIPVPVAKLAMHSDFALALGSDGRLFGWGNNSEGTLGRGDPNPMINPAPENVVRAAFDHRFKDVTAGQGHACGIDLDDVLWCWGRNTSQELGTPSTNHQERTPVKVLDQVRSVVAGAFATCAIRLDGSLFCWGETPIDDMGGVIKATSPTKVELGGALVREVDQQWFHVCAVTTDDRLFCWGRGVEGQLGLGNNTASGAAKLVSAGVQEAATAFFSTCFRRTDGTIACMGANDTGQLGLADTMRRAVPTAW
jgi:alpha-tubulin suppressor-like RCC1 family protein